MPDVAAGIPGVGVNAPFSPFSVVPAASYLSLPTQPTFMQFPTPSVFSAPSSGGASFAAYDPYPSALTTAGPAIMGGSALAFLFGSPFLAPIAAAGLYADMNQPTALNGSFPASESLGVPGLGIPGIDPSAGSIGF